MSTQTPQTARPGHLTIHEPSCRSFQNIVELVGRRWTSAILLAGQRGARRFGEYRLSVPGISDRLLTQRLKELESEGLITRTVIPTTPVQIRYALSPDGEELMRILQPLVDWGYRRSEAAADRSTDTV
ncbi:winged helix-turn-helix transcriptional regulator [Nonomuraea rubra]|uniref:DNA-binding HxlR family transcriptional regulator n=1 Tax=Nonomuraea rubra TaxID=46180 RepID=A0A7X0NRV0_9ACTN|nr:helix-turn-helix domain-containing protein [Nonomuraea rubra]MBB6548469.1 DNA-binding HxlR family transcriptional regulator [Nonomuraea rubra]